MQDQYHLVSITDASRKAFGIDIGSVAVGNPAVSGGPPLDKEVGTAADSQLADGTPLLHTQLAGPLAEHFLVYASPKRQRVQVHPTADTSVLERELLSCVSKSSTGKQRHRVSRVHPRG